MAVQGNTTMYLLAGTGLDAENTIWPYRFAYHTGAPYTDASHGLNMHLFQWLKAHSVSQGYWYMNKVSPSSGYFDVGRQPLVKDYLTAFSEEGLGESVVNDFLQNPNHNYELGIPMIDYVIWSDDDGNLDFTCAFVDRIAAINMATVRIFFTIDAIMSYHLYFNFGPCWVEREHVFQDWDKDMHPQFDVIGSEAEPFAPDEDDIVFEEVPQQNGLTYQLEDLGDYDQMFVTSDIKLDTVDSIEARPDYPAFPSFKPAPRVRVQLSHSASGLPTEFLHYLSIGLYRVDNWENEVFTKLGAFDAFEHILYTYTVPHKLIPDHGQEANPVQVLPVINDTMPNTTTEGQGAYPLEIPYCIRDERSSISDTEGTDDMKTYRPLNAKCYYAPYMYLSVTDCQGASMEWQPQMTTYKEPTHGGVVRFEFHTMLTELPNVPSSLWVENYSRIAGGRYDPMQTIWQMSAYAMTPNASGWGTQLRDACMNKGLMLSRVKTSLPWLLGGTMVDTMGSMVESGIGSVASNKIVKKTHPIGAGVASAIGAGVHSLTSGVSNILSSYGGGVLGGGVTASNAEASNNALSQYNSVYGLPKAVGGLPNGATILSMDHVGYKFFFAHVRVKYLQKVDAYFSMYGYAVNTWKIPNINTRRRWNYVKTKVCILEPVTDAWDGAIGTMMPTWAQEQVKSRVNNGITFWNLRYALWHDDSDTTNDHGLPTPYDSIPRNIIFCSFVKNYGLRPDSEEMKDNQSIVGGYADGVYDPLHPVTWAKT